MLIDHFGGQVAVRRGLAIAAALALTVAAVVASSGVAPAQESYTRTSEPLEADYGRVVENIVAGHIRPSAERLAQASDLLVSDLADYCARPGPQTRGHLDRTFADAAGAVAAMDGLRLGPLVQEHRLERLAFWPDPRGLGLRQVQALLAEADPTVLEPGALQQKSVAVQGLTALEFVLYGSGAEALDTPGSYRCRYGEAIAANVRTIAHEIAAAWEAEDGAAALFLAPGPENPLYRTHKEAAGALVAAMATGLEILADQKIRAPLGETAEKARPRLAFLWRSRLTFQTMIRTLEAIEHEFAVSGLTDLLEKPQVWLGNSITFELSQAIGKVRELQGPVEAVATDPVDREKLKYLGIVAASLKRSIGRELSAAIGLEQSFNALDGD